MPRQGLVEPLATSLSSKLNDQTRVSSPTSSRAGEDAEPDANIYDLQEGRDTLPNTPPTPHSRLESPPPLPPVLPTLDPQVQSVRKAQTDRASAQLAQKMLQGWTLLGEECSNESCHSVPLMRRPPVKLAKKDGEDNAPVTRLVDPRRHCVMCQRDYVREGDLKSYEDFMAASTGNTPSTSAAAATVKRQDGNDADKILHSAAAKKRRFSTQPPTSQLNTSKVMGFSDLNTDRKGKSRLIAVSCCSGAVDSMSMALLKFDAQDEEAIPEQAVAAVAGQTGYSSRLAASKHSITPHNVASKSNTEHTPVTCLEQAVRTLSQHLTSLCEDTTGINPAEIAAAAEALSTTCKSLEVVKALYA